MLHFIWSTKNRQPLISEKLKPLLLTHIRENSIEKGIFIDAMNCVEDHIHLLVSLGTEQSISKVAMLIKGESSFWVNKQELTTQKFEWQDEYIVFSVSESGIKKVRDYITKQEEHHLRKTFAQEYEEFLAAHGLGQNNLAKAM